jgi:alpha-N-arabinofuranosidase
MVNVLQAVLLTNETSLVLTPTYHVFDLYKVHMDALMLPHHLSSPEYELDGEKLQSISVSSSKSDNGVVNITLVNIDPANSIETDCDLTGMDVKKVTAKIITSSKINDHNTFEQPDEVRITDFKDVKISKGKIIANIPAKSVVLLQVE